MPTRGEAVADREIERADSPKRSTRQNKIDHIVDYVLAEAKRAGLTPDKITCPTREEWNKLAVGRYPALPSTAVLMLCADDTVHEVARSDSKLEQLRPYTKGAVSACHPYHLVYFSLAQKKIS